VENLIQMGATPISAVELQNISDLKPDNLNFFDQ
jgi:hypothetical protein